MATWSMRPARAGKRGPRLVAACALAARFCRHGHCRQPGTLRSRLKLCVVATGQSLRRYTHVVVATKDGSNPDTALPLERSVTIAGEGEEGK